MAQSEAQIVNLALTRVGITRLIDSLQEATTEAEVASAVYPTVRDNLLCRAPWPFARKRLALNRLTGVTRSGWLYAYTLPSDCLLASRLYTATPTSPIPFETELADDGTKRILLCDEEAPELLYTAAVTYPALFPPPFVEALAWGLACEFVLALPVRPEFVQTAKAHFEMAIAAAYVHARSEMEPAAAADSEFITERE